MTEVTNAKAAVFNFFNIGSALLYLVPKLQLGNETKVNASMIFYQQVLAQQPKDKNKIYSLHEPDVYVIAKGKDHKQYEYGNKISIVSTQFSDEFVGNGSKAC
jgi:hypothetical protein